MREEIKKIVYGKRNMYAAMLRKIEYKFFCLLRNLHVNHGTNKENAIVLYPVFNDNTIMNDTINRAIWSFPPDSGYKIYYASNIEITIQNIPFQHSFLKDNIEKNNSNVIRVRPEELQVLASKSQRVLVWNRSYRYRTVLKKYGGNVRVIDPWYYANEECNTMKFGLYNVLPQNIRKEFQRQSINNFKRFIFENKGKDYSYIFVTGPNFSTYKELNYRKNALKIVCNTIVKDKDFLEFIGGPDIICFCDPAFHFSTNEYANTFRNLVLDCVKKYGSYIAIPQACVPLISYNYPEIKDKLIGLRRANELTIPSEANLSVMPTGSVITFMMIPLAASLTQHIGIIGADGRGKKENYFWKHNDKVQLTELMECVYETHPTFFRDISYSDKYAIHCNQVRKIVELAEKSKVLVRAMTPSYIPCLSERYNIT